MGDSCDIKQDGLDCTQPQGCRTTESVGNGDTSPQLADKSSGRKAFMNRMVHQYHILRFLKSHIETKRSVFLWLLMLLSSGITPVMVKLAFMTKENVVDPQKFNPVHAAIVVFLANYIVSTVYVVIHYGKRGIKEIWDIKRIADLSPASIGFLVAEILCVKALSQIGVVIYSVVSKSNLILATFLSVTVLKRKISTINWLLVFQLTLLIICFVTLNSNSGAHMDINVRGLSYCISGVTFSVFAATFADFMYKKDKSPFMVQVATGRISAVLGAILITVIYNLNQKIPLLCIITDPIFVWDKRIYGMVLWLMNRDIIISFVLRDLDAVWKTIGSATAVGLTYLFSWWLFNEKFSITKISLLFSVVFNVIVISLARSKISNRVTKSLQTDPVLTQ